MTPTFSLPYTSASPATLANSIEWSPPMITGMAPVSAISRTIRRIGGMLRSTLRLSMGALP